MDCTCALCQLGFTRRFLVSQKLFFLCERFFFDSSNNSQSDFVSCDYKSPNHVAFGDDGLVTKRRAFFRLFYLVRYQCFRDIIAKNENLFSEKSCYLLKCEVILGFGWWGVSLFANLWLVVVYFGKIETCNNNSWFFLQWNQ